jgi:glycerol-3-phosphate dehydrogenase
MKYDLLIIGGGINGLGIAADASERGLKTLIVERNDWGAGTTSASSRLIHGGLRYLQYGEIDLVRESLRERGILARQRPHLVHPISLLIPTFQNQPMPGWMVGVGLGLYHLLAHDPLFPRPSALDVRDTKKREPGLTTDRLTGGYIYPDAQIEFPERLCVELMRETLKSGGEARNHTRVRELRQNAEGAVIGALLHDELTGTDEEVEAELTINAAGPWVDVVNRTLKIPPPKLIGGTWGTHLVLPDRDAGPKGAIYATAKRDNRPFFLLPWNDRLLVGTTDVKFTANDPDALKIEPWEPEYLLEETNHLFPDARYRESDIEATTVGIRPLPSTDGKKTGAITRRHFLVNHTERNGVAGIVSIVGGKLTTYRSLAEEAVNLALKLLGRPLVACKTAKIEEIPTVETQIRDAEASLLRLKRDGAYARRLIALYGSSYREILARIEREPALGESSSEYPDTLTAQVIHAREAEQARTEDDIARRLMTKF